MKQPKQLTCIIEREGDVYVSLYPQIDIATQGDSVEKARKNLIEAIAKIVKAVNAMAIALSTLHLKAIAFLTLVLVIRAINQSTFCYNSLK
jgi:predicted RNase H-like HicB family nuclease